MRLSTPALRIALVESAFIEGEGDFQNGGPTCHERESCDIGVFDFLKISK